MQCSEKQLEEILRRTSALKREKAARRAVTLSAVSVCVCLFLILGAAALIPRLPAVSAGETGGAAYGSLILSSPLLGYAVIAVLAFALGVCVTLLCRALRREKGKDRHRDQ